MSGLIDRWKAGRSEARRTREAAAARAGGRLEAFYAVPPPALGGDPGDLRLLAVDLETTGLDAGRDRILSIGLVPVDGLTIDLSGARHMLVAGEGSEGRGATDEGAKLVRSTTSAPTPTGEGAKFARSAMSAPAPVDGGAKFARCRRSNTADLAPSTSGGREDDGVGQSAIWHGITDDELATGEPLADALDVLLDALAGRALLAHHADIELGFLDAACRAVHGAGLRVPVVDTMVRARELLGAREPERGELRLRACRARHGLPEAPTHHALEDALACAELYLAQVAARE